MQKQHIESTDIAWNEFDIQQEQWFEWLKSENNGNDRWRPSWVLTFRPVKIHKWCQKWALCAIINSKSDIIPVSRTIFFGVKFSTAGGHLEFWCLGSSEYKKWYHWGNKHILLKTSFLFEIQQVGGTYMAQNRKNGIGRWRPSWILIFWVIKIQKWCQKWALYATCSRKSDITRVSMTIYFQVTFSIWPQAAILNFDGWTGQNTEMMPDMDSPCQN